MASRPVSPTRWGTRHPLQHTTVEMRQTPFGECSYDCLSPKPCRIDVCNRWPDVLVHRNCSTLLGTTLVREHRHSEVLSPSPSRRTGGILCLVGPNRTGGILFLVSPSFQTFPSCPCSCLFPPFFPLCITCHIGVSWQWSVFSFGSLSPQPLFALYLAQG